MRSSRAGELPIDHIYQAWRDWCEAERPARAGHEAGGRSATEGVRARDPSDAAARPARKAESLRGPRAPARGRLLVKWHAMAREAEHSSSMFVRVPHLLHVQLSGSRASACQHVPCSNRPIPGPPLARCRLSVPHACAGQTCQSKNSSPSDGPPVGRRQCGDGTLALARKEGAAAAQVATVSQLLRTEAASAVGRAWRRLRRR